MSLLVPPPSYPEPAVCLFDGQTAGSGYADGGTKRQMGKQLVLNMMMEAPKGMAFAFTEASPVALLQYSSQSKLVAYPILKHKSPLFSVPDKKGNREIYGSFSTLPHRNICCDPSLEPSHQDGSNDGSQHMFLLRYKKNYL